MSGDAGQAQGARERLGRYQQALRAISHYTPDSEWSHEDCLDALDEIARICQIFDRELFPELYERAEG